MKLKAFDNKYLQHKLIILGKYDNVMEILKISKISLNFGFKNRSLTAKNMLAVFFLLKILFSKKGVLKKSKKAVLILKIRKGMVVGCHVLLFNHDVNWFYSLFFKKLKDNKHELRKLVPSSKNLKAVSFTFNSFFLFSKLEFFFELFNGLPPANVTFIFNNWVSAKLRVKYLRLLGFSL